MMLPPVGIPFSFYGLWCFLVETYCAADGFCFFVYDGIIVVLVASLVVPLELLFR